MRKLYLAVLLTIMMFGHNYVLNQPQSIQTALESTHNITVTQFNLLYSIPSAISILVIIPLGWGYGKWANALLITGAILLSVGQMLVAIFGGEGKEWYFQGLMTGRVLEGIGAQILYMIQGNLASSWMGKYAGLIFILPECGQILNVFLTPVTFTQWGITVSFTIGFATCLISSLACIFLFLYLVKYKKISSHQKIMAQNKNQHLTDNMSSKLEDTQINQVNSVHASIVVQQKDKQDSDQQLKEGVSMNKKENIFQAGRIFWLMILLCAINECLYFPFLDNGNQLITSRFCIPYTSTGYYLAIPFIAAMLTSCLSSYVLPKVERHKLIFFVSFIPLIGHSIIWMDTNCEGSPTVIGRVVLVAGLCFFGMGIGSYYSVSFPGVGLSIPAQIRGIPYEMQVNDLYMSGSGYACMAFFQTISMSLIPIFSGLIIQTQTAITKISQGYKASSLLFVSICVSGIVVSAIISKLANQSSFIYDDEENFIGDSQGQKEMDQVKSLPMMSS